MVNQLVRVILCCSVNIHNVVGTVAVADFDCWGKMLILKASLKNTCFVALFVLNQSGSS